MNIILNLDVMREYKERYMKELIKQVSSLEKQTKINFVIFSEGIVTITDPEANQEELIAYLEMLLDCGEALYD